MAGPPAAFASLLRARRGFLGVIAPDGNPRVLPVCFTWAGDVIWTAVDSAPGAPPKRIRFVQANSKASFTVDRWDEDWRRLTWLQASGHARVVGAGKEAERARAALAAKYPQYQHVLRDGPVIRVEVKRWTGWPQA